MAKVTDYRKIVLVTDPRNPDPDVMRAAELQGQIVTQIACEDGIVILIKMNPYESIE